MKSGNELPPELVQTLLKMAPTNDEELKLRLYAGELSRLGPAERFLKVLVDIPFAFKRLDSLLFMCTLQEETSTLKESFAILEVRLAQLILGNSITNQFNFLKAFTYCMPSCTGCMHRIAKKQVVSQTFGGCSQDRKSYERWHIPWWCTGI